VREGSFVLVGNGRLYGGPSHFSSRLLSMTVYLMWLCSSGSGFWRSSNISMTLYSAPTSAFREIEYFQTRQLRVAVSRTFPWSWMVN